jgi:NADPH-dependent FMN reductase
VWRCFFEGEGPRIFDPFKVGSKPGARKAIQWSRFLRCGPPKPVWESQFKEKKKDEHQSSGDFYSVYGHVYRMAEAVVEGAKQVVGAEVSLYQIQELMPDDVLEKYGAKAAKASLAKIPIAKVDQLPEADAIIFGTPTRFGNMAAQMRKLEVCSLPRALNMAVRKPQSLAFIPRCSITARSSSACPTANPA